MNIGTMLNEEMSKDVASQRTDVSATNGRTRMVQWTIQALRNCTDVERLATIGYPDELGELESIEYSTLRDFFGQSNALWFEPERHYWWRPAYIRRQIGSRFPIVTMVHGLGYPYQLPLLLASLAIPQAPGDVVIAPSEVSANVLREQCKILSAVSTFPIKIPAVTVVPYGVPLASPMPASEAKQLLGWNSVPVVLFLGRLSLLDKADFRALFEATARLFDKGVGFQLVLAGAAHSGEVNDLWRLVDAFGIGHAVRIYPDVSDIEKHCLLSACDIFVSPSNALSESFGLSIIEAMFHECAIVCSNWSGYRELIDDGENGLLVGTIWCNAESENKNLEYLGDATRLQTFTDGLGFSIKHPVALNVAEFSRALESLIRNEGQRIRLGKSARRKAVKYYTLDRFVASLMTVFRESIVESSGQDTPTPIPQFYRVFEQYAQTVWNGDAEVTADPEANIERSITTGGLSDPQSLIYLERATQGKAVLESNHLMFDLLRNGLFEIKNSTT